MMKKIVSFVFIMLTCVNLAWAQSLPSLHVEGKNLVDTHGNKVTLHGVMDTPSPYFNNWRWGYNCNDEAVPACLNYFEKLYAGLNNHEAGTYCDVFRLHLDPCWTNDPEKPALNGGHENDISRFSLARLEKYMKSLYFPLMQKAMNIESLQIKKIKCFMKS